MLRGKKNYKDMGRVVEFNGETDANTWDDEECDRFQGTGTANSMHLKLAFECLCCMGVSNSDSILERLIWRRPYSINTRTLNTVSFSRGWQIPCYSVVLIDPRIFSETKICRYDHYTTTFGYFRTYLGVSYKYTSLNIYILHLIN